jgi:type VI secretion system protein ImpJ
MSRCSKVLWSQGMFLQPHHFQQEARHFEHLVDARARAADVHAWGFTELVLDEGLFALGRVAILRASGVLPDGSPFHIPGLDPGPPALEIDADVHDEVICLAAPLAREGVTEVDFGGTAASTSTRWRSLDAEVRDQTCADDEAEAVQVGALNLRLLRQRDCAQGFSGLGVARVVERRTDRQVVLDGAYIAPQTRIEATGQLSATATLLHGLIRQRAAELASRMGGGSHGVSEVADFMMLQLLNRADPLFAQYAGAPNVHPRAFYQACVQLAGELATFASDERHAAEYLPYRHDEIGTVFASVVVDLRRMLSFVIDRNAQQIALQERGFNVHVAVIPEADLARTASFVLAVNAQMPAETLRRHFAGQAKLGPAERIRDLANLQLPGIALRLLPVAPRQLPFHAGFHYFEIDRSGELWKQLERSCNLALHVPGEFPGLELELWAIRR